MSEETTVETQEDAHTLEGGLEGSTIKTNVDVEEEKPVKKVEKKEPEANPLLDAINSLKAEIAAMKKAAAPQKVEKKVEPQEEVNWEELFFSDPAAAVKKIEERVEKKLRAEYSEVESRNEQKQVITSFWSEFKKENPDLADEDSMAMVEAELSKSWDYVKDLPFGEARQTLAERARKRMLRMLKKEGSGSSNQRTLTEGSSGKASVGGGDESPKVLSLSEVIKRKQALMRKGA